MKAKEMNKCKKMEHIHARQEHLLHYKQGQPGFKTIERMAKQDTHRSADLKLDK
jgi:hypothetical protein